MPPTLRRRVELDDVAPRSVRPVEDVEHLVFDRPRERPGFHARRMHRPAGRGDALMGWLAVAIALLVGCYALVYRRNGGEDASAVTAWVAGVVTTLALGFCALFVVLAHHELRRWWRPMTGFAGTAFLGLVLLHLG